MLGWVPGVQAISSYRREWLAKDIVAGVVLTTLLVPQGMAYAELAGLPPITGLYTSIIACRLCGVRPVADPGAGPGFLAGADDRGDDPAADSRRRRRQAGGRAGLDARDHGRRDHDRGGRGQARLHRRPDLQADDDRLHERPGADHPGRPAAQAVRVQGRGRRPDRRGHRLRQGAGPRRGGGRRGRGRDRRDRADPGAAAVAAEGPGGADHGGGSRSPRRRSSAWPTTVSAWSGCCPRDSRRSPSRTSACPISGRCSPGRWGSPWCPWPTRSPPRRRSRPAPGRRSAATAR